MMLKKYFAGLALFGLVTSAQAITPEEALKIVPAECNLFVRAEIQDLVTHKPLAKMLAKIKGEMDNPRNPFKHIGIDLLKLDQFVFAGQVVKGEWGPDMNPYVIFTSKGKIDLAAAQKAFKKPEGQNFDYQIENISGINTFVFQTFAGESDPMCFVQLDENSVMLMKRVCLAKFAAVKKGETKALSSNNKFSKLMTLNKDTLWLYYKLDAFMQKQFQKEDSPVDISTIKGGMAALKLQQAGQLLQAQLFCTNEETPKQLSGLLSLFSPKVMQQLGLPAENVQSTPQGNKLNLTIKMKQLELVMGYFMSSSPVQEAPEVIAIQTPPEEIEEEPPPPPPAPEVPPEAREVETSEPVVRYRNYEK